MMEWIPVAMQIFGTMSSASGSYRAGSAAAAAGEAQRNELQFEAAQLEQQAGQVEAAAQRTALERDRQTALVNSRALAIAASTGGASDPTVINLIARNAAEGSYQHAVAIYNGAENARQLRMNASAKRYGGDVAQAGGKNMQAAYQMQGMGSILKGASSLYTRYATNTPLDKMAGDSSGGGGYVGADPSFDIFGGESAIA